MRCSVQGCHQPARFGLGTKGFDYPMCEMHFKTLLEEGASFFEEPAPEIAREDLTGDVVIEITASEEKPNDEAAEALDEVVATEEDTPVEEVAVAEPEEPVKEGYFECKYCGEKFPKSQMDAVHFAAHVRKCKKEHTAE